VLGAALDFIEVTGVVDGLLLAHVGLPGSSSLPDAAL
jgi:hypothetical protein